MKTKRPTKYRYKFAYSDGNYYQVTRGLGKRYKKYIANVNDMLDLNRFDVTFVCTPKQYKNIVACARRRYGNGFKVIRTEV